MLSKVLTRVFLAIVLTSFVGAVLPVSVSYAATTMIQAYPAQVPDEELPRGNVGDAPTGFGPDSWQGPYVGKTNWHARYTTKASNGNMLFHSNALGGPVMDLAAFVANHWGELVEMISIQTDSGWGGFDGYVDGLDVALTNGTIGRVDFGGSCDTPPSLTFYVDQATGTGTGGGELGPADLWHRP